MLIMTTMPTSMKRQRGVALIVTLVILVAVTLIGLTALRAGLLHVAIATNSQVDTILFRAADASRQSLEDIVDADKNKAMGVSGIIGMVSEGSEKVSCLTSSGFLLATPTANNICNFNGAGAKFMTGRNLVAAQTTLTMTSQRVAPDGSDVESTGGAGNLKYVSYSTAVMPSFGSASMSTAQGCMSNKSDESANPSGIVTISECLSAAGASYSTTVQEYYVGITGKADVK